MNPPKLAPHVFELAERIDLEALRHAAAILRAAEFALIAVEANMRGRGEHARADHVLSAIENLGRVLFDGTAARPTGLELLLPENSTERDEPV